LRAAWNQALSGFVKAEAVDGVALDLGLSFTTEFEHLKTRFDMFYYTI
jgi:hypothetical protein